MPETSRDVTLMLEVAFNPPSEAPTWTDISSYLRSFQTRRGRGDELDTFSAGTASFVLDNRDRRFDPVHTGSPYYPNVLPMRRVRIRAEHGLAQPSDIDGLHVWLSADTITGKSNGAALTTWADRSGNGYDATASGAPTYRTSVVNGEPVVRFNGTTDYFTFGNVLTGLTAAEVFAVVKIDNDPPGAFAQGGLWRMDTDTVNSTFYPFTDTVVYLGFGTTARKTVGNPAPALTSPRLLNVSSASGAWTTRLDGTQLFTTGTNTVAWPAAPLLGKSHGPYFLDGDIAEFLVFDHVLTADERANVNAYIADKYGLTLTGATPTSGHPYDLFMGYVDDWGQDYVNPSDGIVTLTATDLFKYLAGVRAPHPFIELDDEDGGFIDSGLLAGPGDLDDELTGERIASVLSDLGLTGDIDDGYTTLPGGQGSGTALNYLQAVALSEDGRLFVNVSGEVVFLDRHAPFLRPLSNTSQATFGDGADELRYSDLSLDFSDTQIRNHVVIRMQNSRGTTGGEIDAEDANSIDEYLRQTYRREVLYTDPAIAADHAQYLVTRYKDPLLRVESLTVKPERDPANLFPEVLGREITDRITIKRRPQGVGSAIEQEALIEGVSHAFSPLSTWVTTWTLSPVDTNNYLILDDATFGLLDTALLGF